MAEDLIKEATGFPTNSQGELLATFGTGNRTPVGLLPPGYVPIRTDNGYVPINLPEYNPTSIHDVLYFNENISPVPTDERSFYWDDEYQCLAMTMPEGVTIQLGQENVIYALAGEDISNGDVVYFYTSGIDHPIVKKASNTSYDQASRVLGVATQSANTGEHLVITTYGLIHDLDTSAYAAGETIYLGLNGAFTNVKPTTDKTTVRVGFIHIVDATVGEILVSQQIEMNSPGVALDIQVRTVSVPVPTTPALFVWDTEVIDTLGIYDPVTGEITIPFNGNYSFNFLYNAATSGTAKQLYSAAQVWNGSTWVAIEYSTRQLYIAQNVKNVATFVSTNPFTAGTRLRFVTWASASDVSIVTESPSAGYTIVAARLMMTGVKTI
jgi:hypothetical protein